MRTVFDLFLRESNGEIRGDGNAPICAAVTRIIPSLSPGLSTEIVNVDIVEPDVRKVLSTDNEESIRRDG